MRKMGREGGAWEKEEGDDCIRQGLIWKKGEGV